MEKDNLKHEKQCAIHDVSCCLWEYGTCWVKSPVTDKKTTHNARRDTETKVVQFYVENEYHKDDGYWLDFEKGWWNNFIPTNCN